MARVGFYFFLDLTSVLRYTAAVRHLSLFLVSRPVIEPSLQNVEYNGDSGYSCEGPQQNDILQEADLREKALYLTRQRPKLPLPAYRVSWKPEEHVQR